MALTLDDLYAQGVQTQGLIKALAAGTPAPPPPAQGPLTIAQANEELTTDTELSYTFNGSQFTFTRKTPFGNQSWQTAWSGS